MLPLLRRKNLINVDRKRIERSHKPMGVCLVLYSTSRKQGRFVMMSVEKGGWVDVDYVTRLGGWSIRAQGLHGPSTVNRGGIRCSVTTLRCCTPPHPEWQMFDPPMGSHYTTLNLKRVWVRRYELHLPIPITQRASTELTFPTRVTSTEVPRTNNRGSCLALFNSQDRWDKLYVG